MLALLFCVVNVTKISSTDVTALAILSPKRRNVINKLIDIKVICCIASDFILQFTLSSICILVFKGNQKKRHTKKKQVKPTP